MSPKRPIYGAGIRPCSTCGVVAECVKYQCSSCRAGTQRRWRDRNAPAVAARDRAYRDAHRAEIYARRRRVRAAKSALRPTRVPWVEDPIQRAAHSKVAHEIRAGRLTRQPCKVCDVFPAQAHHPRGYTGEAALDVVWLCPRHHKAVHLGRLAA